MMKRQNKSRLDSPIATRNLPPLNGKAREAVAEIGAPEKLHDTEWVCSYSVTGIGSDTIARAHGIDAFQALEQAIQGIRFALSKSRRKFSWIGAGAAEYSFAHRVPWEYGDKFAKRIELLIEREIRLMICRVRAQRRAGRNRPGARRAKRLRG